MQTYAKIWKAVSPFSFFIRFIDISPTARHKQQKMVSLQANSSKFVMQTFKIRQKFFSSRRELSNSRRELSNPR